MSTVTPNFNWPVPTSTDLVKDGATAIEALGDSIDASLVDLKGGTTGQVLSKASNTDMDFVWVTDAAGDITGVTAGTGLTGGGTSGTVSLAFDVANYGGGQYAAGKNKVINGDMGIWQRGTSITPSIGYGYTADRWRTFSYASNSATISQQTFAPGTAPVAGYEGTFFARINSTNTISLFEQPIEDVRTFAGQTVTYSFWAKSASNQTITVGFYQNFGTGGSSQVTAGAANPSITTSWTRYTGTFTFPSISGKTIGTSSMLIYSFQGAINNALDIWGVQLEAGSTATPFQTATGSVQGELAACQRYYWRQTSGVPYGALSPFGNARNTAAAGIAIKNAVTMRTTPSSIEFSALALYDGTTAVAVTAVTLTYQSADHTYVEPTTGSGLTANRPYCIFSNNNAAGYIGINAEL